MHNVNRCKISGRSRLMSGAVLLAVAGLPAVVCAQTTSAGDSSNIGLEDIVVTAQKREQRLQDVPISVTALSQDALEVNRVTNVTDLSGLAPNTTSRPGSSNQGVASFSMRGLTSTGVVGGADKEVSIYLDGVYISSTRASMFELPDIARIEVLRGPQGTLFGRNATAGAISVVTRDPTGDFGVRQDVSVGNLGQLRTRTTVDLPTWGPFSAYVSYVHNERDGDVRNLGAGTVWDRSGPATGLGIQHSPKTLGGLNGESVFAAVRFEPSDTFHMTYKFDWATSRFSPLAQAPIGYDPAAAGTGGLLTALITTQNFPVAFASNARRPDSVNNWWTVNSHTRNQGHSLTAEWRVSDSVSVKNILAYRKSRVDGAGSIDGIGGLTVTPATVALIPSFAPLLGRRYVPIAANSQGRSKQWSDELQVNYDSDLLTATVGAIWFHSNEISGSPFGIGNTFVLTSYPASGRVPLGNEAVSYNKATSIAGYAQVEVHASDQIDIVGGIRMTRDKKSGRYDVGGAYIPPIGVPITDAAYYTAGSFAASRSFPFDYRKSKPTFSLGVNYKPKNDLLAYAKFSTGFVSGGSVGGVDFAEETVESWEAGIKADWLNGKLRTNLAIWQADYKDVQTAQGGSNVGFPQIGVLVMTGFDAVARGGELEITALPTRGLTLGGSLGYTDVNLSNLNPILLRSVAARGQTASTTYLQTLNPKWTGSLSAQYETEPLFGDAYGLLRLDASWRGKMRMDPNPDRAATAAAFAAVAFSPASWLLNGRVALRNITLGPVEAEFALWGRNLTNNRALTFISTSLVVAGTFQQARTYGLDVNLKF